MGQVSRFFFITDPELRKEIEMNYLFISELETIFSALDESPENEVKRFGYKKMIIILTASIIEAILLHSIQMLEIKHKKCTGVRRMEPKELGILNTGEKLVLYKEKKVKYDPQEMTFADSIQILGDEFGENFPKELCCKLHTMRRLRNGVHIQLRISNDDEFVTTEIYSLFSDAGEIINICKAILQN